MPFKKQKEQFEEKISNRLTRIEEKLNSIEKKQSLILKKEQEIAEEEEKTIEDEKEEIEELKHLEELEKKIEKEVKKSPITSIGLRDFYKSIIGAFIGIIGHFSFFYGVKIANDITMTRATILFVVAFLIGLLYVYFAGFRKVKDIGVSRFIPVRVLVIYITSICVIIIVLYLFGFLSSNMSFSEIYKNVSTISILAVLGAATADLIGDRSE